MPGICEILGLILSLNKQMEKGRMGSGGKGEKMEKTKNIKLKLAETQLGVTRDPSN